MSYIGRGLDKISNIEKLDVITFDGSSSYTLQKNSVNFTPNSANSLQVSIDGVVQAGNFTVSGSTIDFGVAIPATSTNDFIFHYGTGLVTTVADGAITDAKLAASAITGQTALAESPASDDQFLIYDTSATSFKKLAASYVGGTNTPAFKAYLSSSQSISDASQTKIQFDTEDFDTDNVYDNATNYRFTVPSGGAGKYFIFAKAEADAGSASTLERLSLTIYKNGSGYEESRSIFDNNDVATNTEYQSTVLDLAESDYIEIYARITKTTGGTGNILNGRSTIFGAYKIIE